MQRPKCESKTLFSVPFSLQIDFSIREKPYFLLALIISLFHLIHVECNNVSWKWIFAKWFPLIFHMKFYRNEKAHLDVIKFRKYAKASISGVPLPLPSRTRKIFEQSQVFFSVSLCREKKSRLEKILYEIIGDHLK